MDCASGIAVSVPLGTGPCTCNPFLISKGLFSNNPYDIDAKHDPPHGRHCRRPLVLLIPAVALVPGDRVQFPLVADDVRGVECS